MKIVLIKLGALGDVVRTSYFAKAIKEKYGECNLTWITSNNAIDLLKFNPYIDSVVAVDADESLNLRADLVISLDDEYLPANLAKKISPNVIGAFVNDENRIVYSEDSSLWFDMGLLSKYGKRVADQLKKSNQLSHSQVFSKILSVDGVTPEFYGSDSVEKKWRVKRFKSEYVIGINPFSGVRWQSKELPYAQLLQLIENIGSFLHDLYSDFKLVIFCDNSNVERARELVAASKNSHLITWFTGESLLDFSAAISVCDYVISTDSLGLHLAIAQKIPNLSFYAPTSAVEIDTFGLGVKVISTSSDYCSYNPMTDNSSLTAVRIFDCWKSHYNLIVK